MSLFIRLAIFALMIIPLAQSALTSAEAARIPRVVASTSWAAAFAKAAGATDVRLVAPDTLTDPESYEPKAGELEAAVSKADFILIGGNERFAKKLKEVAGDKTILVILELRNSSGAIQREVTRLGQLFGTSEQAEAFLQEFYDAYDRFQEDVRDARERRQIRALVQKYFVPWARFGEIDVVETFGPGELRRSEILSLSAKRADLVVDSAHAPFGRQLAANSGAAYVQLLNYPRPGMDLIGLFRENARRLAEALSRI